MTHVSDFYQATVDSFLHARSYRSLYESYTRRGDKIPDDIQAEIKSYGVATEDGFDKLDRRADKELDKIRIENYYYCIKLVADGSGAFSSNVPTGQYYVLVKSNHRKGHNTSEILGKVNIERVDVKASQTVNVNSKFDLY